MGLREALMWDLSPQRPHEHWQTVASEWTEAVQMRQAYEQGVDDARSEHEAANELGQG